MIVAVCGINATFAIVIPLRESLVKFIIVLAIDKFNTAIFAESALLPHFEFSSLAIPKLLGSEIRFILKRNGAARPTSPTYNRFFATSGIAHSWEPTASR